MKVYLVTGGDGSDGDEWQLHAIFSSMAGAEKFIVEYNRHRPHWANITNPVETWDINKPFNPSDYPYDPKKESSDNVLRPKEDGKYKI